MHTCRINFFSINCKVMKRFYTLGYYKILDHLETNMEIFMLLQETFRKLWKLEVLKVGQNCTLTEGFSLTQSHICKYIIVLQ